ncbi:hypothetical protein [Streptosporangium sp. NPDC020145]|uniref:hypothetical protein n=1 Tax=Streptosporangium sp. NPDC020145 TaxID=3154694 RepID=UPI00344569C8
MRSTLPLAVLALAAATFAGATLPAAAADETNLYLYSDYNQLGDSVLIPIPDSGRCVQVSEISNSLSARNPSAELDAYLYINDNCTGNPVQTVPASSSPNFNHTHRVASVLFSRH